MIIAAAQTAELPSSIVFQSSPIGAPMEMTLVRGGAFLMGSQCDDPSLPNYNPDGSPYYHDEAPVHKVDVETFYIARLEVTRELWADLMGGYVSMDSAQCAQGYVSYDDALHFVCSANVAFASQMPEGAAFALPSEEQWEFAARGGVNQDGFAYAGSDNSSEVAQWGGNTEVPGEVATKKPNSLGLYDMSGNACEWTSSYYSSDYESEPDRRFRVLRGGGVNTRPGRERDLRVSARARDEASRRMKYYGVRLVLNLPAQSPSDPTSAARPKTGHVGEAARLAVRDGRLIILQPQGTAFDVCGRRL